MPERATHCNDVLHAISNPVRRRTLRYLDRVGLATVYSVAADARVDPASLRHAHLPTLVDANCVRCTDAQTAKDRVVSITAAGEAAVNVLDAVPDRYDC